MKPRLPAIERGGWLMLIVCCFGTLWVEPAAAQVSYEADPINYSKTEPTDRIAQLQQQMTAGSVSLDYDEKHGYMPALLKLLEVPISSQTLVFSQTSLQLRKISPERPRAIYYNDDTYLGWVQNGDVIELSATDPALGVVFYTLDQARQEHPKFSRDQGHCMACHETSRTQNVPGYVVRSVFPDAAGRPMLGSGTFVTDQKSPFEHRWGGWYVTGKHGEMRHMGNVIAGTDRGRERLDRERGANLLELPERVDPERYLAPHSDLVSLMVLEHQTQMQNFITLANFETRQAWHYNQVMNEALERDADFRSESTERRIEAVAGKLVDYLLFSEEFQLTSPVEGSSKFASEFSARGPRDSQGRSLRQLNLKTRLLEYPCSYLIYSASFDALPKVVKEVIYRRLFEVLSAPTADDAFEHLSLEQRQAIREILCETKPEVETAFAQLATTATE
jgi:hypothetical protein